MRDRRRAAPILRLEVAQVGLQDVIRFEPRGIAAHGDDCVGRLERLDQLGLDQAGRGVAPTAAGEVLDDVGRAGERDPRGVDVAFGGRFGDHELPVDLRQILRRQLRLQRVEGQRLIDIGHQAAAGEHRRRSEQEMASEDGTHFGVTPLLRSLKKKRAGSRSISWEMRAIEAASSRICAMRSVAS
jgi:hypothetical protein